MLSNGRGGMAGGLVGRTSPLDINGTGDLVNTDPVGIMRISGCGATRAPNQPSTTTSMSLCVCVPQLN